MTKPGNEIVEQNRRREISVEIDNEIGGQNRLNRQELLNNRLGLLVDQHDALELDAELLQILFVLSNLADLSSDQLGLLLVAAVSVHQDLVLGPGEHLQFILLRDQLVSILRVDDET